MTTKGIMVFSESLNNTFKIAKSVCVRGVPFCFDAKGHYFGTTYLSFDHGLRQKILTVAQKMMRVILKAKQKRQRVQELKNKEESSKDEPEHRGGLKLELIEKL